MKRTLFLDCDGVLADFDSHALSIFGIPSREFENLFGTSTFWRVLQEYQAGFYRTMPRMPDALVLFEAVEHLKPIILTGCPLGGWAEPQKMEWAAEHFPGTKMITCMSAEKRSHMKPGDILVDDYLKYRHLWEEAGGVFVHHTSADSSIAALYDLGVLRD
jgi:hypothetical protein